MRRFGPALLGGLLVSLLLAGCGDADGPAAASDADKPAADASGETASREPAEIYAQYCVNCHGTGMAGAPMVGPEHRLIWSEEIEEEGFPTLVKIAIEGENGMPPRGTCFDCSDEEIEATVLYMLKESGAK
ncbi:c-type cytochrome [Alloalcanivorax venustensis]|jgi:cytochrome c5|uniref:c-type cytochrome n=1 Tax=Alloalcanivorax venustensis TaxID=172371 RepID=UPI0035166AF0